MKTNPASLGAFVALLSLGTLLRAQTVAPQPKAAATPSKDEILTLDAFTVTSTEGSGYRATNSISATGIGTPIGDTPSTIFVVTKDFIADTRSDLINDALRFVPGVTTQPGNESQPFVRGFQGTYTLRNGVFRRQNLTTWNVDNVEVIQGASSIFYSNIRPGGVINYNTVKPVLGQNFATLDVSGGGYKYERVEAAFNAGNDKFAVRVDLGQMHINPYVAGSDQGQKFLSLAATWKITPDQQVTLEAGTESVARLNGARLNSLTNTRYWKNPAAIASGQSVSAWMAANFPGQPVYDEFAPTFPAPNDPYGRTTNVLRQYQSGVDRPLDLFYVAKITDNLAFNAVVDTAWENNEGINPGFGDPLANGTFTNVNASKFINVRDSYDANFRLTYRLNIANVANTLMVGNDNQWVIQRYPQQSVFKPSTGPGIAATVTSNNLISSSIPLWDPKTSGLLDGYQMILNAPAANQFNSIRDTLQHFGGSYIVDQAVLFNKSLFLIAGVRYNDFKQHVWYPGRSDLTPGAAPDAVAKKWTPQLGALYKIPNTGLALFYTNAQAVIPQTQIDASGATVQPQLSKGWDLGVKLDMLGGALTGTLDYYHIFQTNTAISDSARNVANGLPANATFGYYTYGNANLVNGLQFDLNYNISKNYQLVVGLNEFFKAEFAAPNADPRLVGTRFSTLPTTMYTVWNRYQFSSGSLKGLILGGGFHHNSRTVIGSGFNNTLMYTPGFVVADAFVGYEFKAFQHSFKAQVLVRNFTNLIYRDAGGGWGDPRTWVLSVKTRL